MAEILGLDHVQLAMPEGGEDEARDFYCKMLCFIEVPKPVDLAKRGGCWFESGTAHIHLGVAQDFTPARKAHPALLVDDLDEMQKRLSRLGCDFTAGQPLDGYVRGDIYDPFGNRIELMQRLPD